MTAIFVDTYFFLALLNARDHAHERARQANLVNGPMITSMWVLLELADHLCSAENRSLFGAVVDALRADRRYEIVEADQVTLDAATVLYRQRGDKSWSLT